MYVWLGKFQPFPKDGKPIKNWFNQQDGFVDVINQLKNICSQGFLLLCVD